MSKKSTSIDRPPLLAERIRHTGEGSFAFIPHRFLHDGFVASLGQDELLLYFFLVLAGDRRGISFYGYERLCGLLQMTVEGYIAARNGLIVKDLLAFDGRRFQVLSLPTRIIRASSPRLHTAEDMEDSDPATIRCLVAASLVEGTDA